MTDTHNDITISVIMPVYNGMGYIEQSLPPLISMLQRGEVLEVIVVDDSSTDQTPQYAESLGAQVIPSGGRLGPGAARNMAAKIAQGDVIWLIDADVIVHDNAVNYIHEAMAELEIVAVFGSYDEHPPAQNFLSQYKNLVHHFYHHRGRREASTFWSGCGAVRKEPFLAVGGFDVVTYTRPSIEDIELGYRLIERGGKILLVPEMLSTHLKEWRLINLLHTEIFCRAIPWSRLMLNSTGVVNDLNVGTMERVRAILGCLFFLVILLALLLLIPWWVPFVFFAVVVFLNKDLFMLFYRRKGIIFAIRGILYHQFYYLYSTASFAWCVIERWFGGKRPSRKSA